MAGYTFTLTATDGDILGGGAPDRLRIRVWHAASGVITYDNQRGASDTADPVTALGGGSIVIHQPPAGNGRGTQSGAARPAPTVFAVHAPAPNPSRGGAILAVDLPEAADVTASVIDVSGRELERLVCGVLAAGRHELRLAAIDRNGHAAPAGIYFIRVTSVPGAGPRQSAVRRLIVQ